MIYVRKSGERGHFDHGWLKTFHSFSFADYYDPEFMGFSALRVINEDFVAPGQGFGTHGHRDMEIVTYVLEGALEHKDSMGTGSVIRPGEVQRMSAGRGVLHSEFNASKDSDVHLLQIWILPEARGLAPSYEQKAFGDEEKLNRLRIVASNDARQGSVRIHQDAAIYASVLEEGKTLEHRLDRKRGYWVQVARGELELGSQTLQAGDGAALREEELLKFRGVKRAEFLLFDLP